MKYLKSHLKFNKQERSGIFFLLFLLIVVQVGYFIFKQTAVSSVQTVVLDKETQDEINLLKQNAIVGDTIKLYPFNPNFITDYKGYTLGLSVQEISRLQEFRAKKKFVNTAAEFQQVTQVSDSLLNKISVYFKFPEWVSDRKRPTNKTWDKKNTKTDKVAAVRMDLNEVTIAQLKEVRGIGDKLATRIIKFRDRLGGFLIDEQLSDVYGLKPEVVENALKQFRVIKIPDIEKIDINTATAEELSKLVYIQRNVAYEIVEFRSKNGGIHSFDDLLQIPSFPADRINRIALYLSLKN